MTMPMSMSLHELLADQVDSMPVINPVINGLSADSRAHAVPADGKQALFPDVLLSAGVR